MLSTNAWVMWAILGGQKTHRSSTSWWLILSSENF